MGKTCFQEITEQKKFEQNSEKKGINQLKSILGNDSTLLVIKAIRVEATSVTNSQFRERLSITAISLIDKN